MVVGAARVACRVEKLEVLSTGPGKGGLAGMAVCVYSLGSTFGHTPPLDGAAEAAAPSHGAGTHEI